MAGLVALVIGASPAAARPHHHHRRGRHPPAARPGRPPAVPAQSRATLEAQKLQKELVDLQVKGAMYPALKVARKIYRLKLRTLGPDHPETTRALDSVAGLEASTGDYAGALRIRKQLLAQAEKLYGKDTYGTVIAMQGLASQYWTLQDFEHADALYRRVLAINKKQFGADSTQYATYLQMYGSLQWGRHAYAAAEQTFLEAKAILDKAGPSANGSETGILMNLGWLYWTEGQQVKARRYFEKSMADLEKLYEKLMPHSGMAAGLMLSIASIYAQGGRTDWARPLEEKGEKLYRDAIAHIEKTKGPKDMSLVSPLSSLAQLATRRKQYDEAEKLYRRIIDISSAQKNANPLTRVAWLTSLAWLDQTRGRPRDALPLLAAVRTAYKHSYGDYMASTVDQQIAMIWQRLGKYDKARRMLTKLLAVSRRTWGAHHPLVGNQLESLAVVLLAQGRTKQARADLEQALDIEEPHLALVLATGTESDHAIYFGQIAHQLHLAITLNTRYAPRDPAAARLALTTVLRRKGRILDAAAGSVAALRKRLSPDDRKLLDDLADARARLAKLIVAGPKATASPQEYSVQVAKLESEVRRLENLVGQKSAAYRALAQPVDLRSVQAAIPADAALVEIVEYQPYDARAWGQAAVAPSPRRYAAYLLRHTGDPTWVDLGVAADVDKAADSFLASLSDPDSDDVNALGRALYGKAMAPVARALGQTHKVLLAPDGLLNLVPFGALVDTTGRHLIQRFTFTYLTSGRDLLRMKTAAAPRRGPVIIANPRFDVDRDADAARAKTGGGVSPRPPVSRGVRSRDLRGQKWTPLPGTAREAAALAHLLTGAVVLEGKKATEAALKKVSGPRILHIATHGFFLPAEPLPVEDGPPGMGGAGAGAGPAPMSTSAPSVFAPPEMADQTGPENPLLRSGLALAGANDLDSGGEDGILTALEASGLDLWGTQLVVLSACETGVGKVTEGDGVHGLRRALVIAGARALVMSLWQVDDSATRALMTGYYKRLEQGEGRSEALRQVQLQMLRSGKYSHPYYWAAFVPSGDWTPLAGSK